MKVRNFQKFQKKNSDPHSTSQKDGPEATARSSPLISTLNNIYGIFSVQEFTILLTLP